MKNKKEINNKLHHILELLTIAQKQIFDIFSLSSSLNIQEKEPELWKKLSCFCGGRYSEGNSNGMPVQKALEVLRKMLED